MDVEFRKRRALELWKEGQGFHFDGDLSRAIAMYTKSIEVFPTSEAYTFRGWAYSFQRRLEDAISECERAIQIDPTLGNPFNDIGTYLMAQGKLDECVEWFEKAKLAPRYEARHFPYMNLGRVYTARGWILRAIREFESALALKPQDPICISALEDLRNSLH